jgi:hypothetical protein
MTTEEAGCAAADTSSLCVDFLPLAATRTAATAQLRRARRGAANSEGTPTAWLDRGAAPAVWRAAQWMGRREHAIEGIVLF